MNAGRDEDQFYLDVREAARRYSVSEWFFRNRMRTGQVPFYRIGKYVRFKIAELDVWFETIEVSGHPVRVSEDTGVGR